jgi:hypothetical protein
MFKFTWAILHPIMKVQKELMIMRMMTMILQDILDLNGFSIFNNNVTGRLDRALSLTNEKKGDTYLGR